MVTAGGVFSIFDGMICIEKNTMKTGYPLNK